VYQEPMGSGLAFRATAEGDATAPKSRDGKLPSVCRADVGSRRRDGFPRAGFRQRSKESSNPVAPTVLGNEPFGKNVEGHSQLHAKSCVNSSGL
jgi:hypothetical protein